MSESIVDAATTLIGPARSRSARRTALAIAVLGGVIAPAISIGIAHSDRRSAERAVADADDLTRELTEAALRSRLRWLDHLTHRIDGRMYASPTTWQRDAAASLEDVPDARQVALVDSAGIVGATLWSPSPDPGADAMFVRECLARAARPAPARHARDSSAIDRIRVVPPRLIHGEWRFAACAPLARSPGVAPAWVVLVLDARALIGGVLVPYVRGGYRIDASAAGAPSFSISAPEAPAAGADWTSTRYIALAGADWSITVTPSIATIRQLRTAWPFITLAIGVATTALLVVSVGLMEEARWGRRARSDAEATLRDMLETIPDPIEISTPAGAVEYVNAAWRVRFAFDDPPQSVRVFDDAETTSAYARYRARLLDGGPDADFEGVVLGRDGQRIVLSIRSSVRFEDGVPMVVRSIMRDVSAQRAAEDAQDRLVAMIEATSDFIGTAGGNGRIVYLNRAGRRLVGIGDGADVTDLGMSAVFPPAARSHQIAVAVPSALRDGVWSGDTVVRGPTGGEIPVSQVVVAHRSQRSGQLFVSMIMRDRSEQMHREAASTAMHRIALGIADLTEPARVYETVIRELCAATGWSSGDLWLRDDDGIIVLGASWVGPDAGISDGRSVVVAGGDENGATLAGRVWTSRVVIVVSSSGDSGTAGRGVDAGPPRDVATVGVPLLADNELVAVVIFHPRTPLQDARHRIRLVTEVAAQLGRLILQKRTEQALRESEARTRTLSEASMDGIAIIRDFRIVELNGAFRRMFALGEDVSGVNSLDLVDESDRPRIAIAARSAGVYEATMRRADGTTFDGRVTGVVTTFRGAPSRVAVVRDISEWRALDRLKNEFVSTVSHELRTPLTAIRGSLGLLEADAGVALSANAARLVQIARTNTDRLIRLINDLLDLDKIAAGKLELRRARVVMTDVVRMAVDGLRDLAAQRGIDVLEEVESDAAIDGDRDRIVQVLTNLLSNAIKFARTGSVVVTRAWRVGGEPSDTAGGAADPPRGARIRVSVSNAGDGIEAADIGRLFTRFQQLDGSDRRQNGGTGLGLAISKELVEQHGGTIGVDSTPGVETTFWFECPEAGDVLAHASEGH